MGKDFAEVKPSLPGHLESFRPVNLSAAFFPSSTYDQTIVHRLWRRYALLLRTRLALGALTAVASLSSMTNHITLINRVDHQHLTCECSLTGFS